LTKLRTCDERSGRCNWCNSVPSHTLRTPPRVPHQSLLSTMRPHRWNWCARPEHTPATESGMAYRSIHVFFTETAYRPQPLTHFRRAAIAALRQEFPYRYRRFIVAPLQHPNSPGRAGGTRLTIPVERPLRKLWARCGPGPDYENTPRSARTSAPHTPLTDNASGGERIVNVMRTGPVSVSCFDTGRNNSTRHFQNPCRCAWFYQGPQGAPRAGPASAGPAQRLNRDSLSAPVIERLARGWWARDPRQRASPRRCHDHHRRRTIPQSAIDRILNSA